MTREKEKEFFLRYLKRNGIYEAWIKRIATVRSKKPGSKGRVELLEDYIDRKFRAYDKDEYVSIRFLRDCTEYCMTSSEEYVFWNNRLHDYMDCIKKEGEGYVSSTKRVVFFGSGDFPVKTFRQLIMKELVAKEEPPYKIVGLVTSKDKVRLEDSTLAEIARDLEIPVLVPKNLRDRGFIDKVKELEPDVFCVISYKYLAKEFLSEFKDVTAFNIHASLLPFLRGASPITYAIWNEFKETGLTAFLLSDSIDCGDIITSSRVEVAEDETYESLYDKLSSESKDMADGVLQRLSRGPLGEYDVVKQQRGLEVLDNLNAPKIDADFHSCSLYEYSSVEDIERKIRSLPSNVGVTLRVQFMDENGNLMAWVPLKIYEAEVVEPDKEVFEDGGVETDWKTHMYIYNRLWFRALSLKKVQLPGKKILGIEDFLRGFRNSCQKSWRIVFS